MRLVQFLELPHAVLKAAEFCCVAPCPIRSQWAVGVDQIEPATVWAALDARVGLLLQDAALGCGSTITDSRNHASPTSSERAHITTCVDQLA